MTENYAACTNYAFMLTETIAVAQILAREKTYDEIREQVLVEDLFQLRSLTSRQKAWQAVKKSLHQIDREYIELLAKGNADVRRYTYLFLLLKGNRLLRELIEEVLLEKVKKFELQVSEVDLKLFFVAKREQNEVIAAWSETTYQKSMSNTIQMLVKSQLLKPISLKKVYQIQYLPIPESLRAKLKGDGLEKYLRLMLDFH